MEYKNIDKEVVKNYVITLNSIKEPMTKIKTEIDKIDKLVNKNNIKISDDFIKISDPILEASDKLSKSISKLLEQYKSIYTMSDIVKDISNNSNKKEDTFTNIIKQIMEYNNGILSTRMIEPLNISREYLSIMEKNKEIEKVSRGIYISPSTLEDSYFTFQQKYKKAIFSHMNALYFYDMTEEIPYNFTISVPQRYHVDKINEKCNVFYVSDDIYELGLTEVETPSGNKVRAYDKERCICDIIRSKGRMDPEQVKKTIKKYIKSKDKDIVKLSKYAKKMGISDKVMNYVELFYE